jgi:hypothetical protein
MPVFGLYFAWYEEYKPYLFEHATKTEQDFECDVNTIVQKYGDEWLRNNDGWAGCSSIIDFIALKLPDFGYVHLKPFQVGLWGSSIIESDTDKNDISHLLKFFGKRLFDKIVFHNKLVSDSLIRKTRT